jgi:hypothetical protein
VVALVLPSSTASAAVVARTPTCEEGGRKGRKEKEGGEAGRRGSVWKVEVKHAERGEVRFQKERVSKDSERKEKERRKENAPPQCDGTP